MTSITMNSMILSAETLRAIENMGKTSRYFVVNASGDLVRLNAQGKAMRWAYAQRGAALAAARRCGGLVYDRYVWS